MVLGIPLDLCWHPETHTDLAHVHHVRAQDDMGDLQRLFKLGGRWCRQCIVEYSLATPASRAFYEVVRLNKNEFTGNLPPEIIQMIYERLLKKPLLFTECSAAPPTEKSRP